MNGWMPDQVRHDDIASSRAKTWGSIYGITMLDKNSTSGIADLAKKIFFTGLGAIFLTEETIRQMLGDLKLPRDLAASVLSTAKKQKDEFMQLLAQEVAQFLSHVKIHEEIQKALDGLSLDLEAKLKFNRGKPADIKVKLKKK